MPLEGEDFTQWGESFKEGATEFFTVKLPDFFLKFLISFVFFALLLYSFYSVSRGDFNDNPRKNYLLLFSCLALPFIIMFVPPIWNLYTNIIEGSKYVRETLIVFYFLFTFLYLIFFMIKANILDNIVNKLKESLNFFIENFENNPTYFWMPIGIIGIIALIAFFIFSFKKTMSGDSTASDKVVSLAIGFGGLLLIMIATIAIFKGIKNFGVFTKAANWISENNSKAWFIFSALILSGIIPLFNSLDAADDEKFKEEKSKCDNPVYEDGTRKNDTKIEKDSCRKKAYEESYKGKIEFKKEPLIAIIMFLLSGFIVINRKIFIKSFEEDMLRNVLIVFLITLISFYFLFIFSGNETHIDYLDENATKNPDGSINYENQRFRGTQTKYKLKDTIFKPLSIIFLILGFFAFIGLSIIVTKNDDYNRPNHYNLLEGLVWIFKNMKEPVRNMILIGGVIGMVGVFIYFLTTSRTVVSSVTNIVFLSVTVLALTLLYKLLSNTDFVKGNIFFKLLINIVLFIPCLLFLIVEFLYNDIRETPKVVFAVLLGQIFVVSSYFLTPIVLKYLSSYYTGKNQSIIYETESDLLDIQLEKLKNNFDTVKEKIGSITIKYNEDQEEVEKTVDFIDEEKWEKLVVMARKGDGKRKIREFLTKKSGLTQYQLDGLKDIKKNSLDDDMELFIKKLAKEYNTSETIEALEKKREKEEKKERNRLDQLTDYIFYFVNDTIKESRGDTNLLEGSKGMIDREAPNMQNINNKINNLEIKKKNVNERKEIGLLNRTTDLLDKPIYLEKEHKPLVKIKRRVQVITGENPKVEIKEIQENARFQNLSAEMFRKDTSDFNYNYGLSMWVFLHSQGTNYNEGYNKDTNILDYANNPKITYNPSTDKLKVKMGVDLPKCFGMTPSNEDTGWKKLTADESTWKPISNALKCCFTDSYSNPNWNALNPFEWTKITGKINKDFKVDKDSLKKDNKIISIDDVKEELKQYLKVSDLRKNVFIKIKKDDEYKVRFIKKIDTTNQKIKYGKKEEEKNDPTKIHINVDNYLVNDPKVPTKQFDFVIENPSTVTKKNYNLVKKWCKEDMTHNSIDNSNKLITIFEAEGLLKMQKWNNIVINYDLGVLDIFINGELKGSYDSELQYIHDLPVIIGEKEGLSGGICNVKYYPTTITKNQIELTYNALKLKNPPVI